ncbi:hypothetical protein ABIA39_001113 [Nocardia sp. GAS34]|uniref:hypothetical protein n=1 Tax=unclassified Nocardia TaxID=2637762 RepID=UPI003D1A0D82
MGASEELDRSMGNVVSTVPVIPPHHDECVRLARYALGARGFDAAIRRGQAMGMDEAVAYALREQPTDTAGISGPCAALT